MRLSIKIYKENIKTEQNLKQRQYFPETHSAREIFDAGCISPMVAF